MRQDDFRVRNGAWLCAEVETRIGNVGPVNGERLQVPVLVWCPAQRKRQPAKQSLGEELAAAPPEDHRRFRARPVVESHRTDRETVWTVRTVRGDCPRAE